MAAIESLAVEVKYAKILKALREKELAELNTLSFELLVGGRRCVGCCGPLCFAESLRGTSHRIESQIVFTHFASRAQLLGAMCNVYTKVFAYECLEFAANPAEHFVTKVRLTKELVKRPRSHSVAELRTYHSISLTLHS